MPGDSLNQPFPSKKLPVTVREANADDVDIVYDLLRAIARHHDQEMYVKTTPEILTNDGFGANPKFGVLLAEVSGDVVGYVSYTWQYGIWLGATFMQVDDVYVWDTYRGRGVGEALMKKAREIALLHNVPRLKWEVEATNEGALRFYQRLGVEVDIKGVCRWHVHDLPSDEEE